MRRLVRSWMRFLRLPNVLTVPGDVWVGAAVMARDPFAAPWPGVCAAFLFGMALNDMLDRHRDALERPDRPLPAGRISPAAAVAVCLALAALALLSYPTPAMGILLGTITAYNSLKERLPALAAPLMAGCRVLALWIGAGAPASPPPELLLVAGVWGGFIFGVTALARLETTTRNPGGRVGVLTLWLGGTPLILWGFTGPVLRPEAAVSYLFLLIFAGTLGRKIQRRGRVEPRDIGGYLRLLFPLQAVALGLFGQPVAAALALGGWPVLAWISRRVPMS